MVVKEIIVIRSWWNNETQSCGECKIKNKIKLIPEKTQRKHKNNFKR